MKPLICFYKEERFFYSQNYLRLECPSHSSVTHFLKSIEKNYFSDMKIVQINFEFDDQNLYHSQNTLYPSAKATVFILQEFSLHSWDEVLQKLKWSKNFLSPSFIPLMKKDDFVKKVHYIVDQIKKGRIYQANLTAPLAAATSESSENLFYHLQNSFSGHYKALLPLQDVQVLCFSPELFLHQENEVLTTKPIKGSLGKHQSFSDDLIKNAKEEAELSMIVDLLRNDLNSISDLSSAKVVAHREKMQLGYIQHTYSEITVHSTSYLSTALEKTFPGGSISGCPKVESLKVIREVENHQRQVYTGSLGWWQNNNFCLNISIRSLIHFEQKLFYHAGCGIVYDSNPEAEWQEFLLKTGALNVRELTENR